MKAESSGSELRQGAGVRDQKLRARKVNSTSSRDLSTDQRIHFFLLIASPRLLASSTTWIRSGRNKLDPSASAKQLLFSKTTLYSILTKPKRGKCPFRKRKEMLILLGHNVMEFADFLKHAAGGGEPRETTELQSLWLTDYHQLTRSLRCYCHRRWNTFFWLVEILELFHETRWVLVNAVAVHSLLLFIPHWQPGIIWDFPKESIPGNYHLHSLIVWYE